MSILANAKKTAYNVKKTVFRIKNDETEKRQLKACAKAAALGASFQLACGTVAYVTGKAIRNAPMPITTKVALFAVSTIAEMVVANELGNVVGDKMKALVIKSL